jgi:hypothetical protein
MNKNRIMGYYQMKYYFESTLYVLMFFNRLTNIILKIQSGTAQSIAPQNFNLC